MVCVKQQRSAQSSWSVSYGNHCMLHSLKGVNSVEDRLQTFSNQELLAKISPRNGDISGRTV